MLVDAPGAHRDPSPTLADRAGLGNKAVPRSTRFGPLFLLLGWIGFTLLMFAGGPYEYELAHPARLWLFLVAVNIGLVAGYARGCRSTGRGYRGAWRTVRLTKAIIGVVALMKLVELIATGGGDVARVAMVFRDPTAVYTSSSVMSAPGLFSYISIGEAPLSALGIALGVYYWRLLSPATRAGLLLVVGLVVLGALGAAVRGSLVFLAVFAGSGVAAAYSSGLVKITRRRKALVLVSAAVLVIAFLSYFSYLAENRAGIDTDVMYNPVTMMRPDMESRFYQVLPEAWHLSGTVIAFYASHAYYRLGQTMELPFEGSGFGAGHSIFLVRNVARLAALPEFEDRSYGYRLDRVTNDGTVGRFWVTFYAWAASDVTFPGVVVVVFIIGYLLSLAWADILFRSNPLAVPAFAALFFIVYSFPLTNPLQDGPGLATFGGIPLLWLITRASQSTREEGGIVAAAG
ncbi:hypothetical protein BH23GEM9_BH23GEM9_22630 [soil metagenome]